MANVLSGDKEFLAAMVAATLQDLRVPDGVHADPMPESSGDARLYEEWMKRHTFPQKMKRKADAFVHFQGDAVYDHYTAQAVLNGMPFDSLGRSFTLREALLTLGVNDPETVISAWKMDFGRAADTGDRMMDMIHRQLPMNMGTEEKDETAEAGLPYEFGDARPFSQPVLERNF